MVTLCTARFNTKEYFILSTECIYVFCMVIITNSDLFHYDASVSQPKLSLERGTNLRFKCNYLKD
jgi:hypothetical protein